MINSDHSQLRFTELTRSSDGRVLKGGVLRVHLDGVVVAVGVAADVADHAKASVLPRKGLDGDEGRNTVSSKIYAVYKDVTLCNLGKGAASAGFIQIPLQNGFLRDTDSLAAVQCSLTTSSKGANDDDARKLAVVCWECLLDRCLDMIYQSRGRIEHRHWSLRGSWMENLVRPGQER